MDQVSRRGTPVAAAKVFLWYKTGSEQATSGQRNGGDWFGMKEKGKQQRSSSSRKQRAFLAVESKRVLVSNSSKVKSRGRLLRSPTRSHALLRTNRNLPVFSQHCKCLLARRVGPTRASHHQAVLVARRFALFCIARHSIYT